MAIFVEPLLGNTDTSTAVAHTMGGFTVPTFEVEHGGVGKFSMPPKVTKLGGD